MTKQTLYSLRTDPSGYRITKFVDGEVESSYLTTETECECPAGHRPSCRHRQMLPQLLAERIANTHWFFNFDTRRVVDFHGELKSNIDALNELAAKSKPCATPEQALEAMAECDYWNGRKSLSEPDVVGAAQHTEEDTKAVSEALPVPTKPTQRGWRRM